VSPDALTWIERYAAALGVGDLSETEIQAVLDLAGTAAHASERTAAPLSCWLAAMSGLDPMEALAVAREVAQSLGPA
jgi:Domain of unknown function (DUF6457)